MSTGTFEREDWFVTQSGRRMYILDPDPDQIVIEDIAHALSHLCRFGGHSLRFYSVAQHSTHVSKIVPEDYALQALLHDAAEAYLGDVIRPLKRQLKAYEDLEARWEAAVLDAFDLEWDRPCSRAVKAADRHALIEERHQLQPKYDWNVSGLSAAMLERAQMTFTVPLGPPIAKALFLERFHDLRGSA